jgi:hypothetical protein
MKFAREVNEIDTIKSGLLNLAAAPSPFLRAPQLKAENARELFYRRVRYTPR